MALLVSAQNVSIGLLGWAEVVVARVIVVIMTITRMFESYDDVKYLEHATVPVAEFPYQGQGADLAKIAEHLTTIENTIERETY